MSRREQPSKVRSATLPASRAERGKSKELFRKPAYQKGAQEPIWNDREPSPMEAIDYALISHHKVQVLLEL